jgi:hypothetical protein
MPPRRISRAACAPWLCQVGTGKPARRSPGPSSWVALACLPMIRARSASVSACDGIGRAASGRRLRQGQVNAPVGRAHGLLRVLSVFAPFSSASFGRHRQQSSCRQDIEDDRGLAHMPPAPHISQTREVHRGCESERIVVQQRFLHDPRCAPMQTECTPTLFEFEAVEREQPATARVMR